MSPADVLRMISRVRDSVGLEGRNALDLLAREFILGRPHYEQAWLTSAYARLCEEPRQQIHGRGERAGA